MTKITGPKQARESSLGFLIQTLARRIDTTMKDALKTRGVDYKIFTNLMMLAEEDGINQRQLGAKLDFPEYFVSRNIDALVKAGFAERRPDPTSRRSFLIFLTDAGRQKAAELPAVIRATNERYLSDLSEDERRQIVALLQKIVGAGETGASG